MRNRQERNGVVLVLVLLTLVTLLTFVALAVDLGMLAVARTQSQDAADAAAMAGTRALDGQVANNNNYSNAAPMARAAATANTVLSQPVTNANVTVDVGRYVYVDAAQRFEGQFPGPSTENWSLVRARVASNVANQMAFSRVFNFTGTNVQAVATAVHRPRDIAVILDFSGSMRYASMMAKGSGSATVGSGSSLTTNNGDTVIPVFGHYSSGSAALIASSFTTPFDPANVTTTTSDGRAPIIRDFYSDNAGTIAFTAAAASLGTTPGGDNHKKINKNTGASNSTTAADLIGGLGTIGNGTRDATFEANGYTAYSMSPSFNGYTQGPGYWGKTFFMWPPDPRAAHDWRRKYFYNYNTTTALTDNSRLWNTSSPFSWKTPGTGNYSVNYTAILNFIKNSGPNPFPSRLQSGRILYYDAIPNSISGTFPPTDMNERFWKDYIDYVLGIVQTGSSSWISICNSSDGQVGYGSDFTFGTRRITAASSLTGTPPPYMHYLDNPPRPRTHFWFGPLTMLDFLGNYSLWYRVSPSASRFCWWPGTCHEAPMYGCKLGIRAGLQDISNNHPNDLVALTFFSAPEASAGDGGRFNRVRVGLSRSYDRMQESLWYPPSTVGNSAATVRPYHSQNLEVPRAFGSTCYAIGLMNAYNQFSGNTSLRTFNPGAPAGDAGGYGRKGAQKIIIFETDGMPNTTATASLTNNGAYNSYYRIRYNSSNPSSSDFPSVANYSDNASTVTTQINSLCTQIAALDTATPPGYSTPAKRVQIHCIGFGPEFAPGAPNRAAAINTLNQMQVLGNINDGMPSYKIVYGTESQIVAALQQALTQILQSGVQISLVQ